MLEHWKPGFLKCESLYQHVKKIMEKIFHSWITVQIFPNIKNYRYTVLYKQGFPYNVWSISMQF